MRMKFKSLGMLTPYLHHALLVTISLLLELVSLSRVEFQLLRYCNYGPVYMAAQGIISNSRNVHLDLTHEVSNVLYNILRLKRLTFVPNI